MTDSIADAKTYIRKGRELYGFQTWRQAVRELNREKRTVEHPLKRLRISRRQKEGFYAKQSGFCASCDASFKIVELEVDHIVPLSQGGNNRDSNFQLLCKVCNRKKSSKHPSELAKETGKTVMEQVSGTNNVS